MYSDQGSSTVTSDHLAEDRVPFSFGFFCSSFDTSEGTYGGVRLSLCCSRVTLRGKRRSYARTSKRVAAVGPNTCASPVHPHRSRVGPPVEASR